MSQGLGLARTMIPARAALRGHSSTGVLEEFGDGAGRTCRPGEHPLPVSYKVLASALCVFGSFELRHVPF